MARSGLHRAVLLAAGLGAGLASAGCTASRAERSRPEWLRAEMLARHKDLLARDPDAVAEKLARMSRTSFAFFRGTSGLLPREPSQFVTPAAARVAVVGDPHPENIGTFRAGGGTRVVDFNDFDLAGYGSYVDDLRRLALGLWLAADMADLKKKQRAKVVEELCAGYLTELRGLARGEAPFVLRAEKSFGGDLEALLARGDDEEGSAKPAPAASADDQRLVVEALAGYPASLLEPGRFPKSAFALKRTTRLHAGISSFPALRFRAVVEGPSASAEDDWVLELKETRGTPAATVVAIQRQFQTFPDDDPLLGWARAGGHELRVRRTSPDQRRLSLDRVVKQVKSPAWGKKDLRELAFQCGRLLARGHARARGADGKPGLGAIVAAIGDGRGLAYETVGVTGRAAQTVESDLDLFRALVTQYGPLLGWRKS